MEAAAAAECLGWGRRINRLKQAKECLGQVEADVAAECLGWRRRNASAGGGVSRLEAEEFWSNSAVVGFECSGSARRTRPGGESDCEYTPQDFTSDSSDDPCPSEDDPPAAEGPSHSIVLFLPDNTETAQGRSLSSTFGAAAAIANCPGVDWYHLSWPATSLPMDIDYAVEYVLEFLQKAISKKSMETSELSESPTHIQVFLIGHSFGGAVATQAACELTSVYQSLGIGPFSVTIDGLCVIDTVPHEDGEQLELDLLQNARVMLIASGRDPAAADFEAARELFAAVPATRKEVLLLPGHGSSGDRHMLLRLADFVLRGHLGGAGRRPPGREPAAPPPQ